MNKTIVAGVDMVKFAKPGQSEPYRVMASKAIQGAVKDASIDHKLIEQSGISIDEVDAVELHDCIRPIINNLK